MEWKKIPKDVNGLYNEEESTMYEELPIIVVEENCGAYPFLHYVDEDSWYDFINEFSRPYCNYYAKCNELPFLKTLL